MSGISKQVGWTNEANLLYELIKEMKRLQPITGGLGAVELKDALLDVRAKIAAANAAKAAGDNVLLVQAVDTSGTVAPSGSTHSNAPFAKVTDGTNTVGVNTNGCIKTIVADGYVETPSMTVLSSTVTVAAGAKSVTIVTDSSFTGTILGAVAGADSTYTFSAQAGNTLGEIAIVRTTGSYTILKNV